MDTGDEQVSQQAAESSSEELKPGLYVARVIVHYEKLRVPDSCPKCGASFVAGAGTLNLREVNLADTTFMGRLVSSFIFDPDTDTCCDDSGTLWYPYRYECARCDFLLAGGEVTVIG